MQFKAILFDLDGTLLDTLDDLGNSVNRVLAEKGFPTHDLWISTVILWAMVH